MAYFVVKMPYYSSVRLAKRDSSFFTLYMIGFTNINGDLAI
jgi:hypothetical protein